ncbi:hypothetical protein QJS10_CPB17g01772 [Acorus calamus]|uniref:Uncharacterized protein n=1 Tax=Acorus calamus TaxID=4465 RepID=A0AAV9CV88_ACOCL|nr:hypothetical protein QJS10_CPB17g01772 [Acorus calamus]
METSHEYGTYTSSQCEISAKAGALNVFWSDPLSGDDAAVMVWRSNSAATTVRQSDDAAVMVQQQRCATASGDGVGTSVRERERGG